MKEILIMRTGTHFYPIEASGLRALKDEARDHGERNSHVASVEDSQGNVLWKRETA